MPSLYKRGNIWWGQVYKDGKQHSFSLETSNRQEAKRKLEIEERNIKGVSLSLVLREWIRFKSMDFLPKRKKGEMTPYMKMVHYKWGMLISEYGDIPIAAITDGTIVQWKALLHRKYQDSTVGIILRHVRVVFSFAFKKGFIYTDPFKSVTIPKGENRKEYFTTKELEKFYSVIDRPLIKKYFEFMVKTGIRPSEVRNFKWSDRHGDDYMVFNGKEGRRIFPIWPDHIVLFDEIEKLQVKGQDDSFFCNEKGESLVNHDRIGKLFKKYLKQSGLHETKPDLVPYSLRHTFATLLLKDGRSIYDVSKLMGHKDVRTTQHNYDHITVKDIDQHDMSIFDAPPKKRAAKKPR